MRHVSEFASLRSRLVMTSSGRLAEHTVYEEEADLSLSETSHAPNVFKLHHQNGSPAVEPDEEGLVDLEEEVGPSPVSLVPELPEEEFVPEPVPERAAARTFKVLVVDRGGKLTVDLRKSARGMNPEPEILELDRPTQVVDCAQAEDPDVIVLGTEEVNSAGLRRMAQIHKAWPRIVILLSDSDKTWSAAQLASSGASDFLPANASRARLRSKLESALETASRLRVEPAVVTERIVVHEAAPTPAPITHAPAAANGRVFVVASASGGSGKTVVATNLSAYLVKATGGKVLLIDLDLQFGEVAPSLHLHPVRAIDSLSEGPEELQAVLVEHKSGFKALCAPQDPLAGERITPGEITGIFDVARREFDYVVIDTAPTLNETCLAAFDQAETLLITANMDVPSLRNLRRYLTTIEQLSVSPNRTVLVVNREEPGIGLDRAGISQLFPQGFLAVLPAAAEVTHATNMGVPIMDANPKSEVSRRLAEGFRTLVPPADGVTLPWALSDSTPRRTSMLSRKKGKN